MPGDIRKLLERPPAVLAPPGPHGFLSDEARAQAAAAGVPVDALAPRRSWMVCVDSMSTCSPSAGELRILRGLAEYLASRYQPARAKQLGAMSLILDPGCVSLIFHKRAGGDWGYRRSTWTSADFAPGAGQRPVGLLELIDDKVAPDRSGWTQYKARRPHVFHVDGR